MKKTWFQKSLAMLLVLLMVLGVTACSTQTAEDPAQKNEPETPPAQSTPEEEKPTEDEQPVEEDPTNWSYPVNSDVELTYWTRARFDAASDMEINETPIYQILNEKTGVNVTWQIPVDGADVEQAFQLIWYEEELPDIIYGPIQATHGDQYLEDGLIWDLTEYLPVYAPDFWAYINEPGHETEKLQCQSQSGAYFMIPSVLASETSAWIGPVIRQDWLDECGLDNPVTIEEWENVLVTFKEKYGAVMSYEAAYAQNCGGFASGFGAYDQTTGIVRDENDEYTLAQLHPEWLEMMRTLNRWWEMGLIDQDLFTIDRETLTSRIADNKVGVSFQSLGAIGDARKALAAVDENANWTGTGYARTGYDDPTVKINVGASTINNYAAVITTGATEEEMIAALQFLNYGYSEEGAKVYNFGVEGENYTMDADGQITWLRDESEREKYRTLGTGTCIALGYREQEWERESVAKWLENTCAKDHILLQIPMTDEEFDVYANDWGACVTYMAEEFQKFFTGARELSDEEYNKFIEDLGTLNYQGVLDVWNSAYARFKNG